MSVTTVSIAWAFLQISLLCTFSLIVAWLLRGRRPQLVTAILAGTCIASLLLTLISVVPQCQWTLAINEASPSTRFPVESNRILTANPKQPIPMEQVTCEQPLENRQDESIRSIGSAGSNGLEVIRRFFSQYLRRMDREVRDVDAWQQPVAKARNVSLLLFVLLGLSVMTLLWCSSWLYMRQVLHGSQRIDDESILSLVACQAGDFGLTRVPAVRESNLVPIGATVGWCHVTVLLHTDWREWSTEERKAVIAHELAHAVRHDFAWVIVSSWTRILLFFHPMIHALIHRMRLEQELAADQLAAGRVGSAKAYGRALASLALRSQQSFRTSNPKLGSMLAAGQICVTRRVQMLRQGSLKPIQSRSRWSIWAVAAIACSAIPLAGLRGTTQEPVAEITIAQDSPKESDSVEASKPKPLSKEFLAAYPPLEFKGSMVYRPGRFRSGEFGPEVAWFQEWFSISALGRPMPDRATIYGECSAISKWADEERLHGRFETGAGFREGESTLPGQLTKLADPFNWNHSPLRTVSTQQLLGRTITGVTHSTTTDQPEKWLIDDEQGFFLGSFEQAEQFVRGQKFAMDSIPDAFREDYQNAAFGMVYANCETWHNKLESFAKGAPRESEFQQAVLVIKDLLHLGVFIDGCKTPACSVRAVMKDARAAKHMATKMRTLVELGKLALANSQPDKHKIELQLHSSILETMQVTERESEVNFQFDIFVPSMADEAIGMFGSVPGWINLNAEVKNETQGAVAVRPELMFSSLPCLFGQTLDAAAYRGKTVSFELEVQCDDEHASQAGAFAWASSQEPLSVAVASLVHTPRQQGSPSTRHRVLVAKTLAANGSSSFKESVETERSDKRFTSSNVVPYHRLSDNALFRTLTVQMVVPAEAEHISFGCYSKNSEIRIRNVQLLTTKNSQNNKSQQDAVNDATADIPYNVLVMPGYTICKEPTNLNFVQSATEVIRQAVRTSESESR